MARLRLRYPVCYPDGRAVVQIQKYLIYLDFYGAAEGTRTPDPIITNDVLYQLSYTGILGGGL